MKKRRLLFLGVALLFSCFSFTIALASYPRPVGYINDFVDIIPQETEKALEEKLKNYEKTTSIEVAVVLPASLEGSDIDSWTMGLAQEWKVGKKGVDNGLIIVIAPNERKWRIEVGLGLEGDMTDLTAGRLGDNVLVPYLKKGDFPGGVTALVDSVIETLGNYSAQERAVMAQKKAEKERIAKEKAEEFSLIALLCALAAAIFGGVIYIIRLIIRKIKEAIARREFIANLKDLASAKSKKIDASEELLNAIRRKNGPNSFPDWAETDRRVLDGKAERLIATCRDQIATARSVVDDNPEMANETLHDAIEKDEQYLENAIKDLKSIPEEVSQLRKHAVASVNVAEELAIKARAEVDRVKALGIEVDWGEELIDEAKEKVKLLQAQLKENGVGHDDRSREIRDEAIYLMEDIKTSTQSISSLPKEKERVESFANSFNELMSNLNSGIVEHQEILKDIQKENPESVWRKSTNEYAGVNDLMIALSNTGTIISGIHLFSESNISSADREVSEAQKIVEKITSLQEGISRLSKNIKKAKVDAERLLPDAESKVTSAKRYSHKSDVGSRAKSLIREASNDLDSVNERIGREMVNWMAIVTLVESVIDNANKAIRKAKGDIDDAESARRRRRSSSYSSSSSSYSSSSSGSSFGGFGGGSFGGGGASGGW